ncbi:MAG TPA: heme exporter protein CcmB [Chloroflexota bacterium]
MRRWLGQALAIALKDLRRESRTRDYLVGKLVLALLMLLAFAFAFDVGGEHVRRAAPGILWITLIFSGMLGSSMAFSSEAENGLLEGLILAPVDRGAIYAGKFLGILALMVAVEAVVLPTFASFFNLTAISLPVIAPVLIGSVGFSAAATLFAAVAANTRTREVLLPVLLLPTVTPLIISGVRATDLGLGGPAVGDGLPWLQLTAVVGAVYVGVSLLVVDQVLEEME